jgi:hypothetical protein
MLFLLLLLVAAAACATSQILSRIETMSVHDLRVERRISVVATNKNETIFYHAGAEIWKFEL